MMSRHLVAWLLNNNPGWDIQRVMTMKQTGEQITIKLTKPIPVYFTYVTAWATPDGVSISGPTSTAMTAPARRPHRRTRLDFARHEKGHPWGWPFCFERVAA